MSSFRDRIKKSFKNSFRRPQKDRISSFMNNNNDLQDGLVYENPTAHNVFNTAEERSQELHDVVSFTRTRSDGSDSGEHDPLEKPEPFQEPPADLEQNLKQHLVSIGETVSGEQKRFCSSGSGEDLKNLIDSCHQRTFTHLHGLLQNIQSSENCFLLLTWFKEVYLSQEQLSDPEPLLLTDWDNKGRKKLIPHVQEEFRKFLSRILELNRTQTQTIDDEETYIGLYVDIIQYTSSMTQKAQNISPELHDEVQEVCFQELMNFVTSYSAEQAETLGALVQKWKKQPKNIETIYFLKTLRTSEELRKYVQLKGNFLLKEDITSKLKDTEALILKLLMEIIAALAERDLAGYFKPGKHQMKLLADLKTCFPKTSFFKDEQKEVMAQAYEVIAHIYLKQLIRTSRWKLKLWSSAVGPKVSSDTEELRGTVSDLAPGVQLGHVMLLSVPEVLKNKDMDSLKLIVAGCHADCGRSSKDLALVPDLLRWKGLSRSQVTEVLEALPEDLRPTTGLRWSFGCCCC